MEAIRVKSVTADAQLRVRPREDGGESRTIEGYAIVFGQESSALWTEEDGSQAHEVISPDAVSRELLDGSDIKMTLYHDMGRLLARSKNGRGTLRYEVDDRGVKFAFDAPNTQWGDEALELVRTGDIDGCSFMFATKYGSRSHVERSAGDGKTVYTVKKITGLYDFTLTPDPAYPQTECSARAQSLCDRTEQQRAAAETVDEYAEEYRALRDRIY